MKNYTKAEFTALPFDDQCFILEALLPDDYLHGQAQIGFYFPKEFDGGTDSVVPETPPEIKKVEDEKMIDKDLLEWIKKSYDQAG